MVARSRWIATVTGIGFALALVAVDVSAAERWVTSVGYEPQHVIVDPASAAAARIELQFPGRPRPRPVAPAARLALNNVSVDVSAALAAVTRDSRARTDATASTSLSPGRPCGTADDHGLTVCVDPAGRLLADDRERVRAFLVGPTVVYTADAASRTALAEALDSVAPAARDVVVREDATRAAPGRARLERRAP